MISIFTNEKSCERTILMYDDIRQKIVSVIRVGGKEDTFLNKISKETYYRLPDVEFKLHYICTVVRQYIIDRYEYSYCNCIEASEFISYILRTLEPDIDVKIIEGWVKYDIPENCSDRGYDEHTWVEVSLNGVMYVLDVTADQFNGLMFTHNNFDNIIVSKNVLPHGFSYDEPEE